MAATLDHEILLFAKELCFDFLLLRLSSLLRTDFFLESSWVDARLQELGSLQLDTLR